MFFNKVLNEIILDTGQVGSEFKHKVVKHEKEKIKRKKKVFGSWFTQHNNIKHINKY